MIVEIAVVFVLTLINGALAMSELAIVSARRAKLQILADRGSRGAQMAMDLAQNPGRFLSSVQIGITLVGVLAGAFSGATLGARLGATLGSMGVSPQWALPLGVGAVVVMITYLSLIVGELVPKQIALRAPEEVAVRAAPIMIWVARLTAPLVWLLDISGRLILRLLGHSETADNQVSEEEVKLIISEAETAGVMAPAETKMIAGVMRIADRSARGLMTPRHEVMMVDASDNVQTVIRRFRETGHSRLALRDGEPDHIIGVLHAHHFLGSSAQRGDLRALALEAPVVREGMGALDVIAALRKAPGHMVLVYDEYGHFEGIITPMDVLEAITGSFMDEDQDEPKIVQRDDGSYLVAGWMAVDEFADHFGIALPAERDFETVAGLVIDVMKSLPAIGESVLFEGLKIEVVDLDGRRIDKLLVQRCEH